MDGNETVTGAHAGEMHIVVSRGGHHSSTVCVRKRLLTDGDGVVSVISGVDDEGEMVDGEAAVTIGGDNVVVARLVKGFAHVSVRKLRVADGLRGFMLDVGSDDELDVPDAVAAIFGEQVDDEIASVIKTVVLIEGVGEGSVADGDNGVLHVGRVDVEAQVDNTVATGNRGERDVEVTGFMESKAGVAVPIERKHVVADADRRVGSIGRVDVEVHGDDAVTTVLIG